MLTVARYGSYGALALALLALLMITVSGSECRFVGSVHQDYSGSISEPGRTGGGVAIALALLVAIAALILHARSKRSGERMPRSAVVAAAIVFPLALVDAFFWFVKGAFACGLF